MAVENKLSRPTIGQEVYIPSAFYLSHGKDDVLGGRAVITKVTEEKYGIKVVHGIQVRGLPNRTYYWENGLMQQQEELQKRFSDQFARSDPDEREEFNSGSIITKDVIRRWLNEGKTREATHVIVISDSFDYTYYPIYVMPGENPREKAKSESGAQTSVKEVYSLLQDTELQLNEYNAFHFD